MKSLYFLPSLILLASCQNASFRGITAPSSGICRSTDEYVGANFIFTIDNSGSMVEADCPNGDAQDCGMTVRERALLKAFDVLTEATVFTNFADQSISTFSVAKFTPENRFLSIDEFREAIQITLQTIPENREELAKILEFNRRPEGDTPYLNALDLGLRILENPSLANGRKTLLILVTDGEPTDRQPSVVRARAEEVDAKIITIRVNYKGLSPEGRLLEHQRIIRENYPDWALDSYPTIDAYANDLFALPSQISNQDVIEVNSVNDLESKFFEDIIKQTVPCLPS